MDLCQMTRTVRALGLGATALAGGCLLPSGAWAQSKSNSPADAVTIETVVVTAEKRAESSQTVPIALTAISGSTLQDAGIKAVGDLVQLTPSLQFGQRSGNTFIAIRGIGQAGQDIGSQSGVTVSLDGVPLLNQFMMNAKFMDVARVEVLRGPQGTFQGRNATGGAINIYNNTPTDTLEGGVLARAGSFADFGVQAVLNLPLVSDKLLARFAFQYEHSDGWLKNPYLGTRGENINIIEGRATFLANISNSFSLTAMLETTKDIGDVTFANGLGRARPDLPSIQEYYGTPINNAKSRTVYIDHNNKRDVADYKASLIAKWDITPNINLTSTTAFMDHATSFTDLEIEGTTTQTVGRSYWFPYIYINMKQFTQELTLTGDLGSKADFVLGTFFMHGNSDEPLEIAALGYPRGLYVYYPRETLYSYAAYAQFRYKITDDLRLTLAGRYTLDHKEYSMDATILYAPIAAPLYSKNNWPAFTPRVVLDYTPYENTLFYASYSRGFKGGGFNTLGDVSLSVNYFKPEYVTNYELGAKLGFFDQRLRIDLNAFYMNYTNLQQSIFVLNPVSGVSYPRIANANNAISKGVEFAIDAIPYPGLRLNAAVTRLQGRYGTFINHDLVYPTRTDPGQPTGYYDLKGNAIPMAPDWQINVGASYSFTAFADYVLTPRVDWKWQSKVYFDIYNHALDCQPDFQVTNLALTLGTGDSKWALTAYVRNVFDKRYVTQANDGSNSTDPTRAGVFGEPRVMGATLGYKF